MSGAHNQLLYATKVRLLLRWVGGVQDHAGALFLPMDGETMLPLSDTIHGLLRPPRQHLDATAAHTGRVQPPRLL